MLGMSPRCGPCGRSMNDADTLTPSAVSCNDASPTFSPAAFFSWVRALDASAMTPKASQLIAPVAKQAHATHFG